MQLNISDVLSWTGENPNQKNIDDAERILSTGHLIKCGINREKSDENVTIITAFCIQTSHMKEKPHEINAVISNDGKIISLTCLCKAGLGEKCKHAVATLFYCYRKGDQLQILSCTDQKCKWKEVHTNALKKYDPAPITEHRCFSKHDSSKPSSSRTSFGDQLENLGDNSETNEGNVSIIRQSNSVKTHSQCKHPKYLSKDPTIEEYEKMYANIIEDLPESAFAKHILGRHEPIFANKNNISAISDQDKTIIKAIFTNQRNELMEEIKRMKVHYTHDCCQETIKDLYEDFEAVCAKSKLNYADWHKARTFRITGSVCYKIFTYSKNKNPDWKKQAKDLFDPTSFTAEFTEYGKKTEKEARDLFVELTKKTVVETGLIISKQNPWLAYSPNGIVITDGVPSALLEIKCPFKGKSKGIIEVVQSEIKKSLNQEGENVVLKERHRFYGQIQLGMTVINVKKTFFVFYSSFDKQLFMLTIDINEDYVKLMLKALKKIYYERLLHEVCLLQKKLKIPPMINNIKSLLLRSSNIECYHS